MWSFVIGFLFCIFSRFMHAVVNINFKKLDSQGGLGTWEGKVVSICTRNSATASKLGFFGLHWSQGFPVYL